MTKSNISEIQFTLSKKTSTISTAAVCRRSAISHHRHKHLKNWFSSRKKKSFLIFWELSFLAIA